MIGSFHVESDFLALVFASSSSYLCRVEGSNVARDGFRRLGFEIDIVNAEIIVEPFDLAINVICWDPGGFQNGLLDCIIYQLLMLNALSSGNHLRPSVRSFRRTSELCIQLWLNEGPYVHCHCH